MLLPVVEVLAKAVQVNACTLLAAIDQLSAAIREAELWREMTENMRSDKND